MFRPLGLAVLLLALGTGSVVASAAAQRQAPPVRQPQAGPPPDPGADDAQALPEGQLVVMLDSYALFQAQRELSIPDETFGTFAARLKKLQDVRRQNQRLRRQTLQQLRRLAGARAAGPPDDAAIRKLIAALREQDDRAAAQLRQAYDQLDEVLDVRQQARFRLFEELIEQRKLDLLVRARERAKANKAETR